MSVWTLLNSVIWITCLVTFPTKTNGFWTPKLFAWLVGAFAIVSSCWWNEPTKRSPKNPWLGAASHSNSENRLPALRSGTPVRAFTSLTHKTALSYTGSQEILNKPLEIGAQTDVAADWAPIQLNDKANPQMTQMPQMNRHCGLNFFIHLCHLRHLWICLTDASC